MAGEAIDCSLQLQKLLRLAVMDAPELRLHGFVVVLKVTLGLLKMDHTVIQSMLSPCVSRLGWHVAS